MSIGNSPESLSQAMLVGAMFVGRLGVCERYRNNAEHLNQYCRMNHPDCKWNYCSSMSNTTTGVCILLKKELMFTCCIINREGIHTMRTESSAREGEKERGSKVRPLSCLRFLRFQSRVWANLELVGGPQRSCIQCWDVVVWNRDPGILSTKIVITKMVVDKYTHRDC